MAKICVACSFFVLDFASNDANFDAMRTTITVDDKLLEEAEKLSGITSRPNLINTALESYVRLEKSRRLAALGGTQPGLKQIPRRRY